MSFGGTADVAGFGWATEVQAPRPPCSTPLRTNYLEPVAADELEGARCSETGDNTSTGWNAGPLAPPAIGAIERYRSIKQIGSGCFSTVHLAESLDGARVALKRVQSDGGREMREVELLKVVHHPCIVPLLDVFKATAPDGQYTVNIIMEYLPETLHMRIGGKPLAPSDVQCFGFQLLRALAHLDGMSICHRDVKPENVLLDGPVVKLADFGSAKHLKDGSSSTSYICSRWWRAPELVLGSTTYTTSVDWWGCGCTFTEMMLGRPLFTGSSNWGQMEAIARALGTPSAQELMALRPSDADAGRIANLVRCGARPWRDLLPPYAESPDALELPARLLVYTPQARWQPAEALLSRFFGTLSTDSGLLPIKIFEFTQEELSRCSPSTKQELRRMGAAWL